jgi:hypothetical protein
MTASKDYCQNPKTTIPPHIHQTPESSTELENSKVDGQLDHPALRLIAARRDVFMRQGHVAETWRHRDGKKFGPYYRLSYREAGRQCDVYLGRAGKLVERVRQALADVQKHLAQHRLFEQIRRSTLASLRIEKIRANSLLLRVWGLRLKGYEVRGWRYSPLRSLLPRFRRSMPRLPVVRVRAPSVRRSSESPASRLERFLKARDGYCVADVTLPAAPPWLERFRHRPSAVSVTNDRS